MTDTSPENSTEKQIGRNEPCPCGSGKKYKRCCGVAAAPKLYAPTTPGPAPGAPGGFDPSQLGISNEQMAQFAQAFQRLPKGQLQKLQSIMQRAMSGKDVTREAQELERSLPPDFQEMLKGMQMPDMAALQQMQAEAAQGAAAAGAEGALPQSMTEEQARELVAKAASEGKISQEQASTLLEPAPKLDAEKDKEKSLSKFWKKLGGG